MNTAKNPQFFLIKFRKTSRTFAVGDREITDQTHILEHMREFYEITFQKRRTENCNRNGKFLLVFENSLKIIKTLEGDLTEKDLCNYLKSM